MKRVETKTPTLGSGRFFDPPCIARFNLQWPSLLHPLLHSSFDTIQLTIRLSYYVVEIESELDPYEPKH